MEHRGSSHNAPAGCRSSQGELEQSWRVMKPRSFDRAWTGADFMGARRITLRVQPPVPFGEFTMVPAPLSGRPEAEMARAMAAALSDIEAPTAADVYNRLRQAFPMAPLTARVAALGVLMDRLRRMV